MSFHDARTHKARKQHTCGECFRVIQPGETYARHAGVWEGDFWTMKSCQQCDALRSLLLYVDTEFWEGCYGGVGEFIHELVPMELDRSFSWEFRLHVLRCCELFKGRWSTRDRDVVLTLALDAMVTEKLRRRGLDRRGRVIAG